MIMFVKGDYLQSLRTVSAAERDIEAVYELPRSIPQLDRLRGLAILLVLVVHVLHSGSIVVVTRQGWVGVDLFFVLSGFLITGILWDTRNGEHYFRRFYGRRLLRIWPAYLILLFCILLVIPLLKWVVGGPFLELPDEHVSLWQFLLMIQNLFPIHLALSTFLVATWSLAVEEQFYLVWPLVIRRATRRVVLSCLLAGFLLAPFMRILAVHCGVPPVAIYMNPLTHGDGLICGAAVAIWLRTARPKRRTLMLAGVALLVVGLAMFLPVCPPDSMMHPWSPLVFTAVALLSTGLLLIALVSEHTGYFLHRYFFMNQKLAFLGFISYSLYLYHLTFIRLAMSDKLIARLDHWHHPEFTAIVLMTVGVGLSILLAWISRITIEKAALSKKEIFD